MKQTIYRYHSRISVFTGTEEECWQWIVNQAQAINSEKEKIDLKGGIAVGLLFLIVGLIIGLCEK